MLASSWPSTLRRDALMVVLLEMGPAAMDGEGVPRGVERILGRAGLFLKILFKNFYITKSIDLCEMHPARQAR
ncbi:hypothetical protein D3C72_2427160 [compost metagenome]